MTNLEIQRKQKLENEITYGRGILTSEWSELIELRKKLIIQNGGNPNHYNLDDRYCSKKLIYRT